MDSRYGLVMAFKNRNCLMRLDIESEALEDYAGHCDSPELHLSGHRLTDVKINGAISAVFDPDSKLFIALKRSGQNFISIDMNTDLVVDVLSIPYNPSRIVFDIITNSIHIAANHAFGKVDLGSHKFTLLAGSSVSGSSGSETPSPLEEVQFNNPSGFLRLDMYRWMLTDIGNNRCSVIKPVFHCLLLI